MSGGYSRPSSNHDFSLGDTWVISSRAVNEIRAGFSAIDNLLDSNCHCVQLSFPSAILGSPTNSPQWWKEMNIQVNDLLSYLRAVMARRAQHRRWDSSSSGRNSGARFPIRRSANSRSPAIRRTSTIPRTYPAPTRYVTQLGDTSYSILNPTYGAFFQDNWTLNGKLTLNLGLRYDVETGTSNTDVPSPIQPGARPLDKNNIAPRFGFAYDLHGDGRSVIRGGIGRYYDKVMLNLTSNERRTILGQFIGVTIVNPSFNDPLSGQTFEDYKNQKIPATLTVSTTITRRRTTTRSRSASRSSSRPAMRCRSTTCTAAATTSR